MCMYCKHYHKRLKLGDAPNKPACDAYPLGIPLAILLSKVDHRNGYSKDQAIIFEPVDEEAVEYAAELFDK